MPMPWMRRTTTTIAPPQNSRAFCSARGGGSHAEFIAGLLDRWTAGAKTTGRWERATPQRRQ
jgi:hypothetical protein